MHLPLCPFPGPGPLVLPALGLSSLLSGFLSPSLWVSVPFSLGQCPPTPVPRSLHLPLLGFWPSLCMLVLPLFISPNLPPGHCPSLAVCILLCGRSWHLGEVKVLQAPSGKAPGVGGCWAVPKHPERKLSLRQYFLPLQWGPKGGGPWAARIGPGISAVRVGFLQYLIVSKPKLHTQQPLKSPVMCHRLPTLVRP